MNYRRVAVIGTPRSGTRYVHTLLRAAGLDVHHERVGPEGTVSGLFAFNHSYAPGAHRGDGHRPQDFEFGAKIALVRDPKRVLPSFAQVFRLGSLAEFYEELGIPMEGDELTRALRAWVATYRELDPWADRFVKVEEANEDWAEWTRGLGLGALPKVDTRQNWSHGFKPTSWDILFTKDAGWAREAYDRARSLGYD